MTAASASALRFAHPDFDLEAESGFALTHGGQLALVSGDQAIRQSLIMLLTTIPGERLRRPRYGCELHLLAFAPNDDTTHGLAMHYVERAIAMWEPRVEILFVDARRDDTADDQMHIELRYVLRSSGREDGLSLSMDLSGRGAAP